MNKGPAIVTTTIVLIERILGMGIVKRNEAAQAMHSRE